MDGDELCLGGTFQRPQAGCAAVERLWMRAALTPGDERNIKLTTPADLLIGEILSEEVPAQMGAFFFAAKKELCG